MPENFDYGSVENGVYVNDYFKMRLPFDASWDVQSKEEKEEITELGKDLIEDQNFKRSIDASEISNANLFTAFKYELGTTENYNPSISVIAENINQFPHVKRGRDYLDEAKIIMEQMALDYTFSYQDNPKILGNQSFDILNVEVDYFGSTYHQQYMSTITKGFSLLLVISYESDAQREELEALVDNIVFSEGLSKKKG
jgi:hypothetical protein